MGNCPLRSMPYKREIKLRLKQGKKELNSVDYFFILRDIERNGSIIKLGTENLKLFHEYNAVCAYTS